ncbi:MAG: hypothetical protein HUK25_09640 [Treponema sp.]|nr:hypothetical protein [Treponema sp.]
MKKQIIKIVSLVMVLFGFGSLAGCSMPMDSGASAEGFNDISSIMTRSVVETRCYVSGYALYSPNDLTSSQLLKGASIPVRVGVVEASVEGDRTVYYDSARQAKYGYFYITDISPESITFAYFTFDQNGQSDTASSNGSYTIKRGERIDITGDGNPDVAYIRAFNRRKGSENNMWLGFISSTENKTSCMFSIMPEQYSRSVYPGGLIAITPDGHYVVNKYEVGTTNRAAVKGLTYGDYVMDSEEGTYQIYAGPTMKNGAARSLEEGELQTIEIDEESSDVYLFNASNFTGEYNINDLFEKIGSKVAQEDYKKMDLGQAVGYLNKLLGEKYFAKMIYEEHKNEDIFKEMINDSVLNAIENPDTVIEASGDIIIFNRMFLSTFFSEVTPYFQATENTLCGIFPWLSASLGETAEDRIDSDYERAVSLAGGSLSAAEEAVFAQARSAVLRGPSKDAEKEKYGATVDEITEGWKEYVDKRTAILEKFNTCLIKIPLMALAKACIPNDALKQAFSSIAPTAKVGLGGHINISSSNLEIGVKLYALLQVELEDEIRYSIYHQSLFKNDDVKLEREDGKFFTQDDLKESGIDANDKQAMNDLIRAKVLDTVASGKDSRWGKVSRWVVNKAEGGLSANPYPVVTPSEYALDLFKVNKPFTIGVLPMYVSFSGTFDIILDLSVRGEFKNMFMGFTYLMGLEPKCGINVSGSTATKIAKIGLLFLGPFGWGATAIWEKASPSVKPYADCEFVNMGCSYMGLKKKSQEENRVGMGIVGTITPILTLKPAVGVGINEKYLVTGAEISAPVSFALPLSVLVGITCDKDWNPKFFAEFQLDLAIDLSVKIGLNAQGKIGVIKVGTKKEYTVYPGAVTQRWVLLDAAIENDKLVKWRTFEHVKPKK